MKTCRVPEARGHTTIHHHETRVVPAAIHQHETWCSSFHTYIGAGGGEAPIYSSLHPLSSSSGSGSSPAADTCCLLLLSTHIRMLLMLMLPKIMGIISFCYLLVDYISPAAQELAFALDNHIIEWYHSSHPRIWKLVLLCCISAE